MDSPDIINRRRAEELELYQFNHATQRNSLKKRQKVQRLTEQKRQREVELTFLNKGQEAQLAKAKVAAKKDYDAALKESVDKLAGDHRVALDILEQDIISIDAERGVLQSNEDFEERSTQNPEVEQSEFVQLEKLDEQYRLHLPRQPYEPPDEATSLEIVSANALLDNELEFELEIIEHPIDTFVKTQCLSMDFRLAFHDMSDNVADLLSMMKEPEMRRIMASGILIDHLKKVITGESSFNEIMGIPPKPTVVQCLSRKSYYGREGRNSKNKRYVLNQIYIYIYIHIYVGSV